MPILDAYRRRHPEYNYVALTVDDASVAAEFVRKHELEWPVVAAPRSYMKAADVKGYPTHVLLSRDGTVLGSAFGLDQESMNDPVKGLASFERWVAQTVREWTRRSESAIDRMLGKAPLHPWIGGIHQRASGGELLHAPVAAGICPARSNTSSCLLASVG